MRRGIIERIMRLLTLAAVAAPLAAHAALERVGPIDPAFGYPGWYQDTTGLMLDFCSPQDAAELNGGWCLLLPPIPPSTPEVFPTSFSDEHFYWSAGANLPLGGGRGAVLTLAVEGAFVNGPVIAGDQMAFGRMRIAIPSAPVSGTYTIYQPFGVWTFPGVVAGDRIFFTDDVGILCPGTFDCTLATGVGPFLLPSAAAGGPELPPVTDSPPPNTASMDPFTGLCGGVFCDPFFPVPSTSSATGFPAGRMYIADPGRVGPVTGSPLPPFVSAADGLTYNHNVFRVEVLQPGATTPTVLGSTDLFSVTGRVFQAVTPGRITLDRASYFRDAAGTANKLDVFATTLPTAAGRIPANPAPATVVPALVYYDAPCAVDPATGALSAPRDPLTGLPLPSVPMRTVAGWKYAAGQSQPAVLPGAVCVAQTNAVNVAGQTVPIFSQAPVTDQVFIAESFFDPNAGTLSVKATSSDRFLPPLLTVGGYGDVCVAAPCAHAGEVPGQLLVSVSAPPNKVTVTSAAGGLNKRQVGIAFLVAQVNNVPVANNDAFTIDEDCSPAASTVACPVAQVFNVLANDTVAGHPIGAGAVVAITTPPLKGTAVVNLDGTVSYRPNLNASGTDGFSYTVSFNGFVSPAGAVAITVNPINDTPIAVNDIFSVPFNATVPQTLNVFANDTDPDGGADLGTAINLTLTSAPAGATATLSATGGVVSFLPTAGGTYTFTYQAQDKGGGQVPLTPLTSNVASVTVNVVSETITITGATYRANQRRWTVTGTYAPTASIATIQITLANGTSAGALVGTAPNAAGTWTLDVKNSAIDPRTSGATQVAATGPGGGRAVANVTIR